MLQYIAGPVDLGPGVALAGIAGFLFVAGIVTAALTALLKNTIFFAKVGDTKKMLVAIGMPFIPIGLFILGYFLHKASSTYYLEHLHSHIYLKSTPYDTYIMLVTMLAPISVVATLIVEIIMLSNRNKNGPLG